ncbi:MAG: poly-gamma-glutamate biosynthesis protein PgsC/CapC [Polyangiales bacterium]
MNPLHLFPTAGFDHSTTTPVLLGVLVSWLFCETFGWVFAGLVVPGYLAAVLVIDPRAGMVDIGEAILTYGFARAIGEHLPRTGLTSRVFGRERFLLIVLCSIVVRLGVEGAILPRFAPHAAGAFFSIGLVVVPLAANACWKTGFGRGLVQNGVPTLIVFLLLKLVLVPYTNLSLYGFELATEDVAASFLASPKAYILLITGAILAASANVLDGWDFNGILIPALLALVVFEPFKFGATFIEAIVVVTVATMAIRHTRLGRANIEGPRRVVLFFCIDYAMRFLFAATVGRTLPGGDVVGLMGFGYLLPTLLAVKIAQRQSAPLVLLPTAQVSVGAFILGTLIGFSASAIDPSSSIARSKVSRALPKAPNDPESAALWAGALARTSLHEGKGPKPLTGSELAALVDRTILLDDPTSVDTKGLAAQRLDRGVLLLRESFQTLDDRWGDPTVRATAAGRQATRRLVALVPSPSSAPETSALAGRWVAEGKMDAAVLAGLEHEGPSTSPFAAIARDAARALARRDSELGVVVALRRGGKGEVVVSGSFAGAPRAEALLAVLEAQIGPLPRRTADPGDGADLAIVLPESAIAALFPAADEKPTSIARPAALAEILDAAHPFSGAASVEDLLVLRRLVLDPLLGGTAKHSIAAMKLCAEKLGYKLTGPSASPFGGNAYVLVASSEARPLALVVKETTTNGTIVEVPHAIGDGMRDVALRLSTAMRADALLLGLEHGGAARGGAAMRLMHVIAMASSGDPSHGPRVVVLRPAPELESNLGVVGVGAWGGPSRLSLSNEVKQAFTEIGLKSTDRPLDLSVRELGARAVFGDVPVVAAVVDAMAVRDSSLDEARSTARVLATSGIASIDDELGAAASQLARTIEANTPEPTVSVVDLGRKVAVEQSVVARRALASAVASSAARAAVVHTHLGDFLLVIEKHDAAFLASATPIDPNGEAQPGKKAELQKAPTLRDCNTALISSGLCRAEAL